MIPAMNNLGIEVSVTNPYRINGMLGGIRIPTAPAVVSAPMAYSLVYPARTRAGYMIPPTAATVAGLEPEIAANNTQVRIAVMPRPPRKCPTMLLASRISQWTMPPLSINAAA